MCSWAGVCCSKIGNRIPPFSPSMAADSFVASFKLLLIGDSNVGKSCLASRFVSDRFSASLRPTIGIDFKSKDIVIEGNNVKITVRRAAEGAVSASQRPPPVFVTTWHGGRGGPSPCNW